MRDKSRNTEVLVVTAGEVQRALRVCRTTSYEILRRAGAVRVGRALRLPVDQLAAVVGEKMAAVIVERISSAKAA